MLNRRGFLTALAGAFVAPDPEKLLWVPGKKLISVPKAPRVEVCIFPPLPMPAWYVDQMVDALNRRILMTDALNRRIFHPQLNRLDFLPPLPGDEVRGGVIHEVRYDVRLVS